MPWTFEDLQDSMLGRHTRRGEPRLFECGCKIELDPDGKEYLTRCGKGFQDRALRWSDDLNQWCRVPLQSSER